jgi:fluoride ion exporter CrcB/FEX
MCEKISQAAARMSSYDSLPSNEVDSQKLLKKSQYVVILDHIIGIISLCTFTYIGVICRVYLTNLSMWDGIQSFPSIWAQIVGSVIIGFLISHKDIIHGTIYTGLSTGLCGSLTTFSAWNAEASYVVLHLNQSVLVSLSPTAPANRAMGYITVLLLGLGLPAAALMFGKSFGQSFIKLSESIHSKFCAHGINKKLIFILITSVYIITTVAVISAYIIISDYSMTFALTLGGIGTYIRWVLSRFDNNSCGKFPFGTLTVNLVGSAILAGVVVIEAHFDLDELMESFLYGVAIGFCGCLTTVSTFISQCCLSLSLRSALIYIFLSVGLAQVIFITILGTYSWVV